MNRNIPSAAPVGYGNAKEVGDKAIYEMTKQEKNRIIRNRMIIPVIFLLVFIFIINSHLNILNSEHTVLLGDAYIALITYYTFINGGLLKKTTPQYIIHWLVFGFIICWYITQAWILYLLNFHGPNPY
jgi:hypothetical protein